MKELFFLFTEIILILLARFTVSLDRWTHSEAGSEFIALSTVAIVTVAFASGSLFLLFYFTGDIE